MLTLKFLGTGSAFDVTRLGQTNAYLLNEENQNILLIDCGSDCRHTFFRQGLKLQQVDGVYISHLHADHIGGMEWLAFSTYFNPGINQPKLYANHSLMHELWDKSLRGGLESVQKKVCNLTDYFECHPVYPNGSFKWGGAEITPVQTVHVMNGMEIVYSYGLMIDLAPDMGSHERWVAREDGHCTRAFYTADTQFAPRQLLDFYQDADIIFHDCETAAFRSNVHAHYDDLKELPDETKKKMWLMHYQLVKDEDLALRDDGFAGFVEPGHAFKLGVK